MDNSLQQEIASFKLSGIALAQKTTNKNGQSAIDCGHLWQKFEQGNYINKIENRLSDEIFAVYHDYDGDYTQPFAYFIGCKVAADAETDGLAHLTIAPGNYQQIIAQGAIPDCVGRAWKEIWKSDIPRAYRTDFEVYGEKGQDQNNATVEIYIGVGAGS